ncbi:hypothetical protein [Actinoplanes sp. RD1]|uniref:hypothetical protein n=1 Tax=Actinoplanes sp. RD1 TaxID=3064538 RepID=UPI002741841A|nr:hypothetical protein [Actinoplanes sp. RD1]
MSDTDHDGGPAYGPFHTPPTSGVPHPTSGGAHPTSGGAHPTSGGAHPTSGGAHPTSGGAYPPSGGAHPTSGGAHSTSGGAHPTSGGAYPASGGGLDEYGLPPGDAFGLGAGYSGPRIEPTPKQPRGRFLVPALAGLAAGLLLFGTGGWFLGRATAPEAPPAAAAPTPSAGASAGVYERNQIAINGPKFTARLTPMAQGWLPHLSGCARDGEQGGPTLNRGEKARVRCEMDAMSVIFVEYATAAERDAARDTTLKQNIDARTLTPGAGGAQQKSTPSGRMSGNYVEYAYQVSGRTVAGIWWDDAGSPVAAYLLAYWKEGVGQKWDPVRDVWARYA